MTNKDTIINNLEGIAEYAGCVSIQIKGSFAGGEEVIVDLSNDHVNNDGLYTEAVYKIVQDIASAIEHEGNKNV